MPNPVSHPPDTHLSAQLWLYERAMAATSTGIVMADATLPHRPLIYCNPAFEKITGYTREEVIGRNCQFLQGEETDPAAIEQIRQALRDECECQVIIKNYRKDGTPFWNELTISPVRDSKGQLTHFIGVQNDITARKKAEKALKNSEAQLREQATQLKQALQDLQQTQTQLIHSEKMSSLGQLVAGVAHEINNPVSFIYGNISHAHEYIHDLLSLLNLYQEKYPNPDSEITTEIKTIGLDFILEDLPKLLTSMKQGAERIRQIVLSLRNFSRLDESEIKPVNLHEGIDSTLEILQHRLNPTNQRPAIHILKEYSQLPKVECSAGSLNQVFMNLLNNAIDALEQIYQYKQPESLTIRIETALENQWATIRIIDNGMGMEEDVCRHIFEPFFTTKPVGKGTGLGLSISYQVVVEKHGGQLLCCSKPGKGTTFTIKIPLQRKNIPPEIHPLRAIQLKKIREQQSKHRLPV